MSANARSAEWSGVFFWRNEATAGNNYCSRPDSWLHAMMRLLCCTLSIVSCLPPLPSNACLTLFGPALLASYPQASAIVLTHLYCLQLHLSLENVRVLLAVAPAAATCGHLLCYLHHSKGCPAKAASNSQRSRSCQRSSHLFSCPTTTMTHCQSSCPAE
jgi:hypothetical protein